MAVVTGGASGIGEATARRLIAEGASVVVADIQDDKGEDLVADLGPSARYVHCDVSQESHVEAAVNVAVAGFGRLDCMFNNAGFVGAVGPIDEITGEEFDFTMAVLLKGVFYGMKHAARVMKPQRSGVILSTSSIGGLRGGLGPQVYGAAKAAVVGLTRNVAAELAPFGIRVNAIAPGKIATPLVAYGMTGGDADVEDARRRLAQFGTPLPGRPGEAEDIAQAVLYLASPEGGFVTGQTLVVDGGLTTGSLEGATAPLERYSQHVPMIREAGRRGTPRTGSASIGSAGDSALDEKGKGDL